MGLALGRYEVNFPLRRERAVAILDQAGPAHIYHFPDPPGPVSKSVAFCFRTLDSIRPTLARDGFGASRSDLSPPTGPRHITKMGARPPTVCPSHLLHDPPSSPSHSCPVWDPTLREQHIYIYIYIHNYIYIYIYMWICRSWSPVFRPRRASVWRD